MKAILLLPLALFLFYQCGNAPTPAQSTKAPPNFPMQIQALCTAAIYPPDRRKLFQALLLLDSMRAKSYPEVEITQYDSLIKSTYLGLFKKPMVILTTTEAERAIGKMRVEKDEMRDYEFYYSKLNSKFDNVKEFGLYISKGKTAPPVLRYRIKYAADSWLFVKYYDIKFDGRVVQISPDLGNSVERDNGYGGIWEWFDEPIGEEFLTIDSISKAKNVKMRYNGDQYYHDRIVSEKEKTAMKEVIMAYYALGGG